MFNVYTESEIFEDICLFDDYPNWKKIFSCQTQVLVNMTDDELEDELSNPESPIFLFQNANAGAITPIALNKQIESLKENIESVINHPRDAFLLNIESDTALKISNDMGVAAFSSNDLDDNYFKGGLFKELDLDQNITNGWKSLVDMELPVSNALIISDDFLFENTEVEINCGIGNLPSLFDVFLPIQIKTDYHITVIASSGGKSKDWWIKEFGALKAKINNLREYEIKLEIVFTKTIHKRRIISNYINGWADKGFSIFRNSNPEIVRQVNDLHIYRVFDNIDNKGESHYSSATKGIEQLKHICKGVAEYIKNQEKSQYYMVFGDCNKDKTVINRLLN